MNASWKFDSLDEKIATIEKRLSLLEGEPTPEIDWVSIALGLFAETHLDLETQERVFRNWVEDQANKPEAVIPITSALNRAVRQRMKETDKC